MSSLSWIVFDEVERQRARRIMALFEEKESRDELGLGPIRDSIADHLFPGTSTIQTRVRYALFVPWICTMAEEMDVSPERLVQAARNLEINLIDALRAGGEEEGVIGRFAHGQLQRLPSSVYWNGLRSWGIRTFAGSQEAYFASIPALRHHRLRKRSASDFSDDANRNRAPWCTDLPRRPDDLLERAEFKLSGDERDFLIDRLVNAQPDSLLTHLAKAGRHAVCDFIWEHPDYTSFPGAARRLIKHADVFSAVMHGAALLYNLMLAERRENEEWIDRYRRGLSDWRETEFDRTAVSLWSLDDFWRRIEHEGHRIRGRARQFVHRWCELADEHGGAITDLPAARTLVQERERALKGSQSRFVNRTVLDKWGGRSGADRLSFRWREANSHIRDLTDAG